MKLNTDERYTPDSVMAPLERVFGPMWDPCPRGWALGQQNECTDGLKREWQSPAFVNPPYSAIMAWVKKAIAEMKEGCIVVFLVPNDCSTGAFRLLRQHAWGRWEVPFRVKFDTPEGKKVDVSRSHCVFFLGGLK